jgi:hypothetical protein
MTSAISTSSIDESYPVAGQDNNSQGFRDNFNAIKTALNTAKGEIDTLQSGTAKLNVANNFNGVLLEDAEVNKFYGSVRQNGTVSTNSDIDLENGPLQIVSVGANISLRFINWPDSDLYGKIRLHIKNTSGSSKTITLDSQGVTDIKFVSGEFTPSGSLAQVAVANNTEVVVEAWTYDNGVNVYLKNFDVFA